MRKPKRALRVETPCDNRWEDLEPREGGRWCPQCRQVVVDLMDATEDEAWRRFDAAGGELCVRIRPSANGDADFRAKRRRASRVAAIAFGATLAACGESGEATTEPPVIEQPVEPPEEPVPVETAPAPVETEPAAPETAETAPDVETEEDGTDHPAHPGEIHTRIHDRHHGRMGGAVARPVDDQLDVLEGL